VSRCCPLSKPLLMPANLPPQYLEAEKRLRAAKTAEERISALEEMLAIIPHHKGTDKIIAMLRRRLAKTREEAEQRKKPTRRGDLYRVQREGAAQVVLAGLPNVGKSSLLAALTNATPEVADFPYTTQRPIPGMLRHENVQIQLVDTPPIMYELVEPWLYNTFRTADLLLLTVDLSDDPAGQVELILDELGRRKIFLEEKAPCEEYPSGSVIRPCVIIGTKLDLPEAVDNLEALKEEWGERFPVFAVSAEKGMRVAEFARGLFRHLNIIRVYTKSPGKKPDLEEPFILKRGSTVEELAEAIHKDLAKRFKYARIWGSERYAGQKVARNFVLNDGDIIELHV